MQVFGENGHQKTLSFLKPLSRVEIFETRAYRFC